MNPFRSRQLDLRSRYSRQRAVSGPAGRRNQSRNSSIVRRAAAQFIARASRPRPAMRNLQANARTAGFLGIEKKFFDSAKAATAIVTTTLGAGAEYDPATLDCLNCPAQADGPQSRDGRKITMDSMQVSGTISVPPGAALSTAPIAPTIVVYLVLDSQTNAAQMNSEDMFFSPLGNNIVSTGMFHELENGPRFKTLAKCVVPFEPIPITGAMTGATGFSSGQNKKFDMFVNLKGLEVNFDKDVTTSVVAAIRDNSLHLIAFADNVITVPTIAYNARLRFRG